MTDKQLRIITHDCEEISEELQGKIENLRGASILITGGTGFIGSWLSEVITFLNDNYAFKIRLYLLSRHAYQFKEIAPHLSSRHDISLISNELASIYELPEDITYIIHAAGSPDNRLNASDPMKVFRTIVNGTNSLLDTAARLPNLKRMLNISSGLIYGSQPIELDRIKEEFLGGPDTNTAMSTYTEGKRMAEVLCSIFRTQQRMEIVTARPFAFIGPYQRLNRPWAINNFISEALNGGPIRILGDGCTIRSYMYPSDMVNWLLTLLVSGKSGQAYNLGSVEEISLYNLALKIASFFPQKIEIQSNIAPATNKISRLIPDIGRAENLNLKNKVSLNNALLRSIEWFKDESLKTI